MDEDKYWEQPEDLVLDEENGETAQEEGSQQGEESVKHEGEAEKGETIGKFKSEVLSTRAKRKKAKLLENLKVLRLFTMLIITWKKNSPKNAKGCPKLRKIK